MSRSSWKRRIERAAELEVQHPAAAELLRFYGAIARYQQTVFDRLAAEGTSVDGPGARSQLLLPDMDPLLALVSQHGTAKLGKASEALRQSPHAWPELIEHGASEPTRAFFARVLWQPYTECAATRSEIPIGETRATCPFCGELPVVAALRPEGEGGKRSFICGLCFTEWEFRRLLCPACGEEDHQKLVYQAEDFPDVRVEACDSCNRYLKAVDLTKNGLAVPEVDEMAALSLDLWAVEKGYAKFATNILGV